MLGGGGGCEGRVRGGGGGGEERHEPDDYDETDSYSLHGHVGHMTPGLTMPTTCNFRFTGVGQ